jgi:hypothetical protein
MINSTVDIDTSGVGLFKSAIYGLAATGLHIKLFSDSVAGVNPEAVSNSRSAVGNIVKMVNNMSSIDISGIGSFKSAIAALKDVDLSGFVNAFNKSAAQLKPIGGNIVESLVSGIKSKRGLLLSAATDLMEALSNGINNRKTIAVNSMNKIVTDMLDKIKSKASTFISAGSSLMTKLAHGIDQQKSKVKSALSKCLSGGVTSVRDYYDNFYSAGSYLVTGLADGISENTFRAEAKAAAMAYAAYEAAKEALDINSPSKIFRGLGYSVPEGFAVGIDNLSGMVENSTVSMADVAIDGVKNSIARIADVVNTDIDSQPTIRPVLDLSDVESGAGLIGGMFGNGLTIGASSNVGTLSSMMNRINQNGGNGDIISAIDKLRNDLSGLGSTTYQINGISYSDDSAVSQAIETLVRAAVMERRM